MLERGLLVGEAVLAAALEASPEAVTLLDAARASRPVVYCNTAFCALSGYSREEVLGRPLVALFRTGGAGELFADDGSGAAGDETEVLLTRRDGSPFWAALRTGQIFGSDGKVTHLIISHRDVTAQHERDAALQLALTQAERANWAKSRLIAVAGHDLRQPLHTISGSLELLQKETALSNRGRRLLHHAEIAAADLDEELKALAQISDVKQDLAPHWETIDLDELIESVAAAWRPRAEHKGLTFSVVRSGLQVRSDRSMLRTILRNLIGNAVKYTACGRILVGGRRAGPMARLEVWDTGPGVSPHMITKIFEAFERADAPGEGLGLGLWIVQRTAELLGHTVEVRTRTQRGSCFSLALPRA